ncbi:MAG TPA: glycine--tRNA ligase subunit beta [Casimicrobiaceae bacterium]|nr:glycine--tRNA ligase subunit beta [Casimicrobiaceae bacterium]
MSAAATSPATDTATLLVEIVTEELPPKALKSLEVAFVAGMREGLASRDVLTEATLVVSYATPRRLAVSLSHVRSVAPDAELVERLMPRSVAEDAAGQPTVALQRRLDKIGRGHLAEGYPDVWDGPDHLYVRSDGKADQVWLRTLSPGQPLDRALSAALDETIEALPIPKMMSYPHAGGYYNDVRFVRPAHRLVALHGSDIVRVAALGLAAGRTTGGHRFLGRATIDLETADAYAPTLEAEGKVLPDFAQRRAEVIRQLVHAAEGASVIMPDALLDEVTSLVESPAVYAGSFDRAFLEVPQECLILTMQQNQKFFALADAQGKLTHRFLLVSNLVTQEPEAIVRGNERVLRARLADAKFFFDHDRKLPLASRVQRLSAIVYQHQLGTLGERVERLRSLARGIAAAIGANAEHADRAAMLAKADLVTEMVAEFPELQGTMGRHYARFDGEAHDVADAIAQHYWPRFAGDSLPERSVAQAVALADKLETLAGMFGVGALPTGDKDPFGLRRAAIGVLRIVIERELALPLPDLLDLAFGAFAGIATVKPAATALADFLYDRLRAHLREQGYTANQVEAVLAQRPARIDTVPAQLAAVKAFEALPEAQALSAANKRIVNILKKSAAEAAPAVDRARLAEGAEHDLWLAFQHLAPAVDDHCASGDYASALRVLATAKPAVDRFFDDVMVMTDDPSIRANRLALLRGVAATMNRVADISKLAG